MDNTKESPTVLSLCTGYGGIERGLEMVFGDVRVVANVEIEAFAVANLVAKMEEGALAPAPIYTDLKSFNGMDLRESIDILTGGYPCQPFSCAGKRLGEEDPRHLWPHILRVIDEVMPRVCFFENVEGHISKGLREVLTDLESRGYRATFGIFSAESVGASHRRKRVFILAYSASKRIDGINRDSTQEGRADEPNRGGEQIYTQWPSRPDAPQHEWEEARTTKPQLGRATNGPTSRVDRLRLLGNGVVPQTAALAWKTLTERIEA